VKRIALLLLLLPLAGCASQTPYATTVGILPPGSVMNVRVENATVNAFAPMLKDPKDRFTVSPTATGKGNQPPAPLMRPIPHGVSIVAPDPLASLLLRVPEGVTLVVDSKHGDVNITNIPGSARVTVHEGDGHIIVGETAEASADKGNLSVTMGATSWPGTLHFSDKQGDIVIWITETAKFDVHLHTDNGTLFSDFDLRGVSEGKAETIDGKVNGGSDSRLDIYTANGAIRLLRLHPEA
jgi:hypothetical protein